MGGNNISAKFAAALALIVCVLNATAAAQTFDNVIAALETDQVTVWRIGSDPAAPTFSIIVGTGVRDLRGVQELMQTSGFAERVNSLTFTIDNHDFSLGMPPVRLRDLLPLTSLERLTLQYTAAEDWPALSRLSSIRKLTLHGEALANISMLAGVNQVETLELENMQIASLTPLSSMAGLRSLSIEQMIVEDGGSAALPQLRSLTLREMPQASLDAVAGMPNLESVTLQENRLSDISPLLRLARLSSIEVRGQSAPDLGPLLQIQGLRALSLNVQTATIQEARICAERPGLRTIRLLGVHDVSSLAIFDRCTDLTNLELTSAAVLDLSPVATHTALEELAIHPVVRRNGVVPIADLGPLAALTNLRRLSLRGVAATDFSPLIGLRNIEMLDLSNTQLRSLDIIRNMPNLRVLNISGTRVVDLSALASAPNLETLNIANTRVRDISVLAGLERLTSVITLNAPVRDHSVLDRLPFLATRSDR